MFWLAYASAPTTGCISRALGEFRIMQGLPQPVTFCSPPKCFVAVGKTQLRADDNDLPDLLTRNGG